MNAGELNGQLDGAVRPWRRYPAYSVPESQWLTELPSHWQMKQLKYVASIQTGLTLGKDHSGRETVTRPYLRVANVQDGYLDLDRITEVSVPVEDVRRHELRPGDVLMTEGGDFDKLGRGYVWEGQIEGCLHQNHIFAVRPKGAILAPHFLAFLLGSGHGRNYFTATSQQTTNLASTNSTKLKNFPVPYPCVEEQLAILAFLDRETARIDALIESKERMIVSLEEQRAAMISEVLIRGVEGASPWPVRPLKYALRGSPRNGISPPASNRAGGVLSFSIAAVRRAQVTINEETVKSVDLTEEEAKPFHIHRGDILVVRGNGNLNLVGTCGVVGDAPEGCVYPDILIRIRPGADLLPSFLVLALNSPFCRRQIEMLAKSVNGTYKVSSQSLGAVRVPIPPTAVQQDALDTLNRRTSHLDTLAQTIRGGVSRLQEYRTALISAAVTGKIDVRNHTTAPHP